MASAAVVGANIAQEPEGLYERQNGIISGVVAPGEKLLPDDADEDGPDVEAGVRLGNGQTEAEKAEDAQTSGPAVEDLFGDDESENELPDDPLAKPRELDDKELDSGDDEGRKDRAVDDVQEDVEEEEAADPVTSLDVEMPRQVGPEPSDGEMYILKVPPFMAVEPRAWQPAEFQPPSADHHSTTAGPTFSAFNTAMTTLRWRRSPSDRSQLQSNARINRWSDGSLTFQLASDPTTQYDMPSNPLAPPQRNPVIPTPTSIRSDNKKSGRSNTDSASLDEPYNPNKDALTYLATPYPSSETVRITHKITTALSIAQSSAITDDAIEQLQNSLAAATNATKVQGVGARELLTVDEDPELERKRQELAERDKMRARKRTEAQRERELERSDRALGKVGLGSRSGGGGLNASMLEDEEGTFSSAKRAKGPGKPRAKKPRRPNSEYSSDEDYGRKGFQVRQEEYESDDGFLARSDEEEEEGEEGSDDGEDPDDGIVEERRRERTPKRDRDVGGDEDAEGEVEDDGDAVAAKAAEGRKRRKVVVDDEEEE
ncbi:hypothetical protein B0A48_02658 [Cryoendolithus antarcticus]|uniref:Leo1-like protein n=1 Tax=Cryoendolithus antarcticus TaxID=1507870 RepID=A0A1V8TKW9_9PEZI|nr:hypothetical protein B0A48_02658 [Cryoendolithus antarcticus]